MKTLVLSVLITTGATFILISCDKKTDLVSLPTRSVTITGEVQNIQPGLILLEEFVLQSNSYLVYDTIPLNQNNTFSREIYLSNPGFFRLNFFNKQFITVILDEDDIHVAADGGSQNGISQITGSSDVEKLREIATLVEEYRQLESELNQEYAQAVAVNDSEKAQKLTGEYMLLQGEKTEMIKQEIERMGISLATVQALSLINKDEEFEFFDNVVSKLIQKYPNVPFVQNLANEVERLRAVAIGQMAPEISLPTPEGGIFKLSSLRGDYVLIDFWAEWCKPCRMENPNVLRAYNRFKDQGFKILGVSLDRSRDKWLKGIAEDGLPWNHVSDLNYFNSEAARAYNVSAIPFSVLLDPEGKIIAKNLRGKDLHTKLEEIYGRDTSAPGR
ncbi:MAG TPA: TlpA disulfide reductase family protein [Cyclobacteriaceae bacterium]|jgi:peroxiredoxin